MSERTMDVDRAAWGRTLRPLALGLGLLLTIGCGGPVRELRGEAERVQRDRVAPLLLPACGPRPPTLPRHAARVVVTPDGVAVDDLGFWQQQPSDAVRGVAGELPPERYPWRHERAERLERLRVPADTDAESPESWLLPGLHARLGDVRAARRQARSFGAPEFRGLAVVYAPPETPFATLGRVFYTLGMAEFSGFHLAVRGSDGALGALPLATPKIRGAGTLRDLLGPSSDRMCMSPTILLGEESARLVVSESSPDGSVMIARRAPASRARATRKSVLSKLLRDEDGEARTRAGLTTGLGGVWGDGATAGAPRPKKVTPAPEPPPPAPAWPTEDTFERNVAGAFDFGAVVAKLRQRSPAAKERCDHGTVACAPETTLQELAFAVDALLADGYIDVFVAATDL